MTSITNGWNNVYPQVGYNTNLLQQASAPQQQTAPVSFAGRQQFADVEENKGGLGLGGWTLIALAGLGIADWASKGKLHNWVIKTAKSLVGKGGEKAFENGWKTIAKEADGAKLVQTFNKEGKVVQEHIIKDGKVVASEDGTTEILSLYNARFITIPSSVTYIGEHAFDG